jgi:hypothetical protein
VLFLSLLQFLQFRSEEVEFVAGLLHKILFAEYFCYFEFVAIFCSSEEEEFIAEFFCCFECVAAIFFAGCRIFVLFWSVKLQQSLLHFQEKKLCCRILCCFEVCCSEKNCSSVEVNFFVVFGACCSIHFAVQEKRNLFQIFVVVLECVAAIFGGSREEIELKGGDNGIFAADMTGTESQEAAVVTEVLDKALLEEETIKR